MTGSISDLNLLLKLSGSSTAWFSAWTVEGNIAFGR